MQGLCPGKKAQLARGTMENLEASRERGGGDKCLVFDEEEYRSGFIDERMKKK